MDKSKKNILINSTLAFVSAFLITTILHESGHFIVYYLAGAKPVLYHNYVQTPDQQLSLFVRIISALAGPFASLFQGIIFGFIVTGRKKEKMHDLFYLWLSLLGFVNFFGYLMMTPLSTAGDTGKVAEFLNLGYPVRILTAVSGLIILIFIILKMGKNFSAFIPAEKEIDEKRKYVYQIMFYPILIGSAIDTMLAFPIPVMLSAIYPATSAFVIMSSFGVILKSTGTRETKTEIETRIQWSIIFLTVSLILVNRFLTLGVG